MKRDFFRLANKVLNQKNALLFLLKIEDGRFRFFKERLWSVNVKE